MQYSVYSIIYIFDGLFEMFKLNILGTDYVADFW